MRTEALGGLLPPVTGGSSSGGASFSRMLREALERANRMQLQADQALKALVMGQVDVHQAIMAVERAELSLRLMLEVRNRLIAAYDELMRMQV